MSLVSVVRGFEAATKIEQAKNYKIPNDLAEMIKRAIKEARAKGEI